MFFRCVAFKKAFVLRLDLTSESVEGSALSFQSVDNVHCCDSLSLCMLCVCNGIADYVFQEHLEYSTGLFVDQIQ